MTKHLVLLGGGHAHLPVLLNLLEFTGKGCQVTLVSPGPYHYYSGMAPGLLAGRYQPYQIRFNIARLAVSKGAIFVQDTVLRIDPLRRRLFLKSGHELDYDLVSFNIGSEVADAGTTGDINRVIPVKPIANLVAARQKILAGLAKRRMRLVVVGGGPSGVELSGNLWRLIKDADGRGEITLVAGGRLLADFSAKARSAALNSLAERRIGIIEGVRAATVADGWVRLDTSDELPADLVFLATGTTPPPVFAEAKLAGGPDGGLLVDDTLRSISFPEIFGGGDCISLENRPLSKVGVYAVRQGPLLRHNLLAVLNNAPLRRFVPQRRYLQIFNLGDDQGLLQWGPLVHAGRWPLWLKDRIDRRFMARFQVSGELAEPNDE